MRITITSKLDNFNYFTDEVYLCKKDVVKFIDENLDKIDQDFCILISKEKVKEKNSKFKVAEVYQ